MPPADCLLPFEVHGLEQKSGRHMDCKKQEKVSGEMLMSYNKPSYYNKYKYLEDNSRDQRFCSAMEGITNAIY